MEFQLRNQSKKTLQPLRKNIEEIEMDSQPAFLTPGEIIAPMQ